MTGYTTREVAEILGLPPPRVRAWARSGLLDPSRDPRGHYRFSFRDLVLLKAIAGLLTGGLPPRRVRRALEELRRRLPEGRPLSSVRVSADGEAVVVRDVDAAWEVATGQLVLDFDVADLASTARPYARGTVAAEIERERALSADDWYNIGVDLEAVAIDEATRAYLEALAADPDHSRANVNLGRLLHERGRVEEAIERYRRALAREPENAVAAYNLAVALEDRGDADGAIGLYRRAVRLDPARADAHYNLARIYESRGEREKAFRHWVRYRALVSGSGA